MLTTILDEAINGWTLTIFGLENGKAVYVYETLAEAQQHRAHTEFDYEYKGKRGVQNVTTL